MNCSTFKANFSAYLEGELAPDVAAACDEHLDACQACAGLMKAYRAGIGSFGQLAEIDPPADLFERVMEVVNQPAPAGFSRLPVTKAWVPLAAAAGLILALTFGLFQPNVDNFDLAIDEIPVDSTMDMVTVQMLKERPKEKRTLPAQKAYLASYNPDDEAVLSYGVSRHPVIVESGVSQISD